MASKFPVVAVVGRPNVGKSTFFNRVVGKRIAIVDDQPGVTRDRNFFKTDWAGRDFFLVDTGGVIEGSDDLLDKAIRKQAVAALREADLILFLVDGQTGLHPLDQRLAETLRKERRSILLVVNKMDNYPEDTSHLDFWRLGLGEPMPVSSISGKGSGDLLDRVVSELPAVPQITSSKKNLRIAVIGKPNVGKSSFINRLFGEDRVLVDKKAGTTRDPIDTIFRYKGEDLVFVDTAGLRRQSRVKESLEYYSALRTERVVREVGVCLVLMDATEPVHIQDIKIAEKAWEAGAGVVVVVNKWDLVDKDHNTSLKFETELRNKAPFLKWAPIIFTSALSGQRIRKCLEIVLEVEEARLRRIQTSEVNDVITAIVRHQPPPHCRGRAVNLKYATQISVAPPTFLIFSNLPKAIPDHYIRYIQNSFRDHWGFTGSPIRIRFKSGDGE
ncbi:MAG: ribosome biogenesis GTPase Der [Longimicrobiales bacterium]|nr:ribosome biogenesis GTPase Der [Longimicrobiales bacterium]